MAESTMRNALLSAFKQREVDACAHEDLVTVGIPDVSYGACNISGWIELKSMDAWPKRATTKVKIKHFTPEQKRWMLKRGIASGYVWLLLRVDQEWLLLDYVSAQWVGDYTVEQLREEAQWTSIRPPINWNSLIERLKENPNDTRSIFS